MTTGMRGGRKGDVGGSQRLVRVSLEALHSDIDQEVTIHHLKATTFYSCDGTFKVHS